MCGVWLLIIVAVVRVTYGDDPSVRLNAKIYTSLGADEGGELHYCYRMTNATHVIGCQCEL
jgi:hypothetical protein